MSRFRSFLFPDALVDAQLVTLDVRESHHLVRVLRAKVGDSVEVLDGKGSRYFGYIAQSDARAVKIKIESVKRSSRRIPKVTLVQSIPKGKTMDLILRMATEIGAAQIQPVFTAQGEVYIQGKRLLSKVDKWKVTMIESCKQCGLGYLPELLEPASIEDWLSANPSTEGTLRLVASLETSSRSLQDTLAYVQSVSEVIIAVGPEGDFTDSEYRALEASEFQPVRLGENVLRSETAAVYLLSVLDQCL
ncbi:MAG: RsmE family RNA methyltransferase [Verrucomicrobiota bacterium]|nr:RsmE family RNA methyltransferase [Verrucomicrobiota bacterium]MEC8332611.1 RsmE family RNA methyltransferase [Verrucomicrobiota bacterium]